MTLEEMRQMKAERGITCREIADATTIPFRMVDGIFDGSIQTPRYDILLELQAFFEAKRQLRDPAMPYGKRQGDYTIEDYDALSEDKHVELIDGVIYDMAAPTFIHQILALQITIILDAFIKKKHGSCTPIMSPIDVQLDCNDTTMMQPDIIVVCDHSKITNRCIYGAPDLVIEIISASTLKNDSSLKLSKYEAAGVREYWMVDFVHERVLVYDFLADCTPAIYGWNARIPVAIFENELKIDMKELKDYISERVSEEPVKSR
ncbi:MAG: Uma2 family endonuclease [Hespellia sp.]|nr:Uma2 family endonuclease [Hespellia sp.]